MADGDTTFRAALWRRHPVLHGLVGLTPLLAVSTRVIDAVIFGLVVLVVVLSSSLIVGLLRDWLAPATRLLAVLITSAAVVSIVSLLLQVWLYEWHQTIGIYLPLVAVSSLLLAWLETEAMTEPLPLVMAGALGQGLALWWLLVLLSLVREPLGQGSLLAGLPGNSATMPLFAFANGPLPLLAEPPGGLLLLGALFAIYGLLKPNSSGE